MKIEGIKHKDKKGEFVIQEPGAWYAKKHKTSTGAKVNVIYNLLRVMFPHAKTIDSIKYYIDQYKILLVDSDKKTSNEIKQLHPVDCLIWEFCKIRGKKINDSKSNSNDKM
jgi:hypothetical protein